MSRRRSLLLVLGWLVAGAGLVLLISDYCSNSPQAVLSAALTCLGLGTVSLTDLDREDLR